MPDVRMVYGLIKRLEMKYELHFQPLYWLYLIYGFCFFDVACMYGLFLIRLIIPFQKFAIDAILRFFTGINRILYP